MNKETTRIGYFRRSIDEESVSYVMEALPIPKGWDIGPAAAVGPGHLRLLSGRIEFVGLDISLEDRISAGKPDPEQQPEVSISDLDPADSILRPYEKRRIHSRLSTVDLFDLDSNINGGNQKGWGRSSDRRLASADYRSRREIESIRQELAKLRRQLTFTLCETAVITFFLAVTELLPAFGLPFSDVLRPATSPLTYLLISLGGLGGAAIVSAGDLAEAFRNTVRRRFNNLTAIFCAMTAGIIHILYMLCACLIAHRPATNTFAAPICLALLIYTANRLMHTIRVAKGFGFVVRRGVHSAVVSANDSPIAADLRRASGTSSANIAYVTRTRQLSHYFRNACREDRCSIMISNIYPVILIASAAAAVISAVRGVFLEGDPVNAALSALCAALVTGIPITGLLSLEMPLRRICAGLRHRGVLLNGWNAVDKFGNTDAFAIGTADLFPRGSVRVRKSFSVNDMDIEEVTSIAASVLIASGGALAEVFGEIIRDEPRLRQSVDSVTYEKELGITAWVRDKKVLVGNQNMMELHRVLVPGGGLARLEEFENMRKNDAFQMLYVAVNGRLMGVYMLEYRAALSARNALMDLIAEGTSVTVYTCDANINVRLITAVFDVPPRFISIMDNEGSRIYDSVTYGITDSQEALIATDGSLSALAAAIRAAVRLRENESVSLMVQSVCFCAGFVFVAGLSCISPFAIDAAQILIMQTAFVLISAFSVLKSL